jgi:hypothetical protein
MYQPIAYTYEADVHCPECATERFGAGLDAAETEDTEGNPIGAVFTWDEWTDGAWCGDCHEMIIEPDTEES